MNGGGCCVIASIKKIPLPWCPTYTQEYTGFTTNIFAMLVVLYTCAYEIGGIYGECGHQFFSFSGFLSIALLLPLHYLSLSSLLFKVCF
jgi:hypothetical protein